MFVEEIPSGANAKTSTVYFSSSINLTARPGSTRHAESQGNAEGSATKKARTKVNYNLTLLMNAQTEANKATEFAGPMKSAQQIQMERLTSKRLTELAKDSLHTGFELPKNFQYNSIHSKNKAQKPSARLGNTPTTKKILLARRNLNLYFEEERNLIAINTILGLNYQFLENTDMDLVNTKRGKGAATRFKPRIKLCCICGSQSHYLRCYTCGLFTCGVRCNNLHNELRCV